MIRLVLPLPPNRANERAHWRKEKRLKDAYDQQCWVWYLNTPGRPKRPRGPMERARISAKLFTWNEQDADNLMARLKHTQDWLVEAGFIIDDSPKVLEWVGMPEQEIDRSNRRVEITLEEVT